MGNQQLCCANPVPCSNGNTPRRIEAHRNSHTDTHPPFHSAPKYNRSTNGDADCDGHPFAHSHLRPHSRHCAKSLGDSDQHEIASDGDGDSHAHQNPRASDADSDSCLDYGNAHPTNDADANANRVLISHRDANANTNRNAANHVVTHVNVNTNRVLISHRDANGNTDANLNTDSHNVTLISNVNTNRVLISHRDADAHAHTNAHAHTIIPDGNFRRHQERPLCAVGDGTLSDVADLDG
jgi:hypothetical protein